MSARPKLAPVPTAPKPRLRRVTLADAARAHPNNPEHQRRWLKSISTLRTKTRDGWKRDQPVQRIQEAK